MVKLGPQFLELTLNSTVMGSNNGYVVSIFNLSFLYQQNARIELSVGVDFKLPWS